MDISVFPWDREEDAFEITKSQRPSQNALNFEGIIFSTSDAKRRVS